MSILGVNNTLERIYQNKYKNYNTETISGMSFLEELYNVKEVSSFKDIWESRFSGAYYHVMDASNIPIGVWGRNDFPFEKFFQENVDESILSWRPSGAEPAMTDPSVQSRLESIRGQNSIVVPPELDEKLKNNPELVQKIMAEIDYLFAWNGHIPGPTESALIVLDKNGEIVRWRLSGGGGFSGPTEEEIRQFEAEQKKKTEKKAEYMRILEESALKRAEIQHNQYQENLQDTTLISVYKFYDSQNR